MHGVRSGVTVGWTEVLLARETKPEEIKRQELQFPGALPGEARVLGIISYQLKL